MMSSGTQAKLPVIDFSDPNLKPGSPEWDLAKHQVRQAMEEYSCFEALFDQVVELRNEVMVALEEAFDLPLETKRLYVSDKHFYGYFESTTGLLESLMVDEAQVADSIEQGLTTTLWPQGNISFSKTLVSFTEVSSRLEKIIRRMILEIFGVDKYADELDDNTNYMLKLMKYNAPPYGKPTSGVFAHCDKNMVTLLYQNEVDGLQIQNKDGEWMNIKPSPDSFIVMVGESFNALLNGGVSPTYHHVLMKGNNARYGLGLFSGTVTGYHVKAPDELVNDNNPILFKPFDYEEYLGFYFAQVPLGRAGSTLQAYCGV
ncbi:gibberellin 20 oxidase 1 [Hibiscus syriacus]|uniref:Gibberellin 20 oxidase 1 n=1 Tax=Hibiscus syriacus TaxID=106335 RepID=A0A6A2ZWT9_HIBSY|nr:gibberellin 20 oxidase 1 [Hibiscus syriacus]